MQSVWAKFAVLAVLSVSCNALSSTSDIRFIHELVADIENADKVYELGDAELFGRSGGKPEKSLNGRFVHMTDIHIDLHYLPSSTISSSCHRLPFTARKGVSPKQQSQLAGPFGAPLSACDSPSSLVDVTFDFVKRLAYGESDKDRDGNDDEEKDNTEGSAAKEHPSPSNLNPPEIPVGIDFVVWTGDNARHDSDPQIPRSRSEVLLLNEVLAQELSDRFNLSDIPIIPTIGNNDVYPHNTLQHSSPFLQALGNIWAPFIPKNQHRQFKTHGSFVYPIIPGWLVIFSINTLDFFQSNPYAKDCIDQDSQGLVTLKYFGKILKRAKANSVRVLVIGHVPPSEGAWYPNCRVGFVKLIRKYGNVIASIYGHVNVDHFILVDRFIVPDSTSTPSSCTSISKRFELQSLSSSSTFFLNTPHVESSNNEPNSPLNYGIRSNYLNSLIQTYSNIVQYVKNGVYSINDLHLSLVSPSVVPNYYPSLRLFTYNKSFQLSTKGQPSQHQTRVTQLPLPTSFGNLLNYHQFYLNLTQLSSQMFSYPSSSPLHPDADTQDQIPQQPQIRWDLLYTASETLKLKTLNLEGYLEFAERIVNDANWRAVFLKYFYVGTGMEERGE